MVLEATVLVWRRKASYNTKRRGDRNSDHNLGSPKLLDFGGYAAVATGRRLDTSNAGAESPTFTAPGVQPKPKPGNPSTKLT
jgi:hypothetical protein